MIAATTYDWPRLVFNSHYEALVAIQEAMRNEDYDEAWLGLEELTDAVSQISKKAVKSHLIRLMAHVLKWKAQPTHRSKSWMFTIWHSRDEIRDCQEETPRVTDETIHEIWKACFAKAKVWAERETEVSLAINSLTWQEVFDDEYELEPNS